MEIFHTSRVPNWIKNSETYKIIFEDVDGEFPIEKHLIKKNKKIKNIYDFIQIVKIINYWGIEYENDKNFFRYINRNKKKVIKYLYKIDNLPTARHILFLSISFNYYFVKYKDFLQIWWNEKKIFEFFPENVDDFFEKLVYSLKNSKNLKFLISKELNNFEINEYICVYEKKMIQIKCVNYFLYENMAYSPSEKILLNFHVNETNKLSIVKFK